MKPTKNMEGQRFPSPGRCIYCGCNGATDGLREEHIIPLSLGGTAVIDGASCTSCEKITSYLDGFLANKIFGEMRLHGDFPRKRRKEKPKPTHLPTEIEIQEHREFVEVPLSDHPHHTILPLWEWPGIAQGIQPSQEFGQLRGALYWLIPPTFGSAIGLKPDEQAIVHFRGQNNLNVRTFARGLAKIAYCHMVAEYGLGGFRRLVLPQIILGTYPYVPYFVGSDIGDPDPPGPSNIRHTLSYDVFTRGRLSLLMMSIRLFANSGADKEGMPTYRVVCGARQSKPRSR